ncbi:MAG: DUF4340 domain-containing protein, partial [Longimicrobiales bacterium]
RTGLGTGGGGGTSAELGRILAEIGPGSVEAVLLVEDGDTVRLTRSGDRWAVDGFRADSGRVARFWDALAGTDVGNPVARNPDNHPRLGLSADQASTIVLRTTEGPSHEILLGDSGPTDPSVYVRLAGRDDVHLLESSLAASAGQSVTTWRDHTIARVDTSRVQVVELTTPEDSYTLARTPASDRDGEGASEDGTGGWTVDGAAADPAQARNLLGGLNRILASDFYAVQDTWPESVQVENAEVRRLVALGAGSDTLAAVDVRGSAEAGYAVRTAGDSIVYEIASFDVTRLFPPRQSLEGEDDGPEEGAEGEE